MIEIIQGSPEWFAARLGKVTASRVSDVVARTKTGWGASRANYMAELIAERLTGESAEKFTNSAMQWGTDKEPDARTTYEFQTGAEVTAIGFADHPTIPMSGASPDGLVGFEGLVEIKCPNTATHLDTLLSRDIPQKYVQQMQWQMACTERTWCDFVSFDPRLPGRMSLFVLRVLRDDVMIRALEKDVLGFLAELETKLADLNKLYKAAA